MKRIVKIITVNILLILFSCIIIEFGMCTKEYFRGLKEQNERNISLNKPQETFNLNEYLKFLKYTSAEISNPSIIITKDYFRPIPTYPKLHTPPHKNPILLLGCSFTFGEGLEEKELFSTQLANKTDRLVYNLGLGGRSPRTSLYLLRENFKITKNEILKNNLTFEYVIYTYIPDHKRRLYVNLVTNSIPYYKINKNNKLEFINYFFLRKTYLYKSFTELLFAYKDKHNIEEVNNLFTIYMKEINDEIKSKFSYGNNNKAKFVIFVYEIDDSINWDVLKKEGIIIIQASDLGLNLDDEKYRLKDGHPNAKAWEVIVPALAKELNL